MLSMGKGLIANSYVCVFVPLMAGVALRMGHLGDFWKRDGTFGMACGAGCFIPLMTPEAGFLCWPEGGGGMGVVVNVVVAICANMLQVNDM